MTRSAAAAVLAVMVASCSDDVLVLPHVEGVRAWLAVISSDALAPRGHVLTSSDAIHLDLGAITALEALAYTEDPGLAAGPLPQLAEGDPLPDPDGTFKADLDRRSWITSEPSSAVSGLRVPFPAEDCERYTTTSDVLPDEDGQGVLGMTELTDHVQTVYTSSAWYRVYPSHTMMTRLLVPGLTAVTRGPDNNNYVVTREAIWSISANAPTRYATIPPELDVRSLAVPGVFFEGVLYGLTRDGILFQTDSATTTIIHRFARVGDEKRGMVVADGLGVLAGFAGDSTFVRADRGMLTSITLPVDEGVSAIARFGEHGIVVGTTAGLLRAERDGFAELADPLQKMPRGVPITALETIGDRLYFGGRKIFGHVSARGFICQADPPATIVVRYIADIGEQLLVTGLPIDEAADAVFRYARE